jgi:ABC-2 type transport system ATP-binding protein
MTIAIPLSHSHPRPLAMLRGAGKRFGAIHALDRVDLHVQAGEVLAVLGGNGAGKSTALGLLTGRLSADEGEASLFGLDPRDPRARRGIGVMLQEASLPDGLRVSEHVHLQSSYYPSPRPVAQTLALAGLDGLERRGYGELSGGQQRSLQFALAICGRPPLLFVDEPTTGLDVEARRGFWKTMRTLRDDGCAIVLTTHYLEEADALADRIVLLAEGRVLAEDTPAGLKARASGKRVRARSTLSAERIRAWAETVSVHAGEHGLDVVSHAPEALLRRWLAADPRLADLEVRPLSRVVAFLTLTAAARAAEQVVTA